MKLTEIQIDLVKPKDGLIGFASIVIDSNLYLSSIAIHKKLNSLGYRLTYPSKGKFNIFYPINKEASKAVEQAIFEKLKNVMKKVNQECSNTTIQI
ncbi:MAG: septation protein SpoVG family protein [Candidatus Margulisiibacteriota bacterium]|jgi:stage V sporulation protein G